MKKPAETIVKVEEKVKPFTKQDQVNPKPQRKAKPISVATPTPEVAQPAKVEPPVPVVEAKPTQEPSAPLTLESLQKAFIMLRTELDNHSHQIEELQTLMSRKRKVVPNGRVQVKDNETGAIYKSKNAVFQSMLKAGSLDALVKAGTFGADPSHNTFGVYALFRAYPGRFVEVHPDAPEQKA